MLHNIFEQLQFLVFDIKRWKPFSLKSIFYLFFEQGIWGVVIYRLGRMLFLVEIPIIKIIFRFIAFLMHKFAEMFLGVSLKPGTAIGPGIYVGHTGSIVIHPRATIGKNLNIGTGVIIGEKGVGHGGYPVIGDDVYIGVGAKILGDIKIGNKVKIGANAVVLSDIPDGATAVGVPAKIIKEN
mgnify:CR=1 FL=1